MLSAFEDAYAARPKKPLGPTERDGHWLTMPGALGGTTGFVRTLASGTIEVELYDHSEAASASFGGDVSTIYTIAKADLPTLAEKLASGFGRDVAALDDLPEHLTTFLDVQSLIDWLIRNSGLAIGKRIDFEV